MDNQEPGLANTVRWLEDEHRQNKALHFKLQQQLDQFQAALWSQAEQLRSVEDSIASLKALANLIPRVEENVRQAMDGVTRANEAREVQNQRLADVERSWSAELARDRESQAQLLKNLEQSNSDIQALRNRLQLMDGTFRRSSEALSQAQMQIESLSHSDDGLDTKLSLMQESLKHRENDIRRLDQEQEVLRMADDTTLSRLRVLSEQVRSLEEQERLLSLEERLRLEFAEKLDLHQVERQRLERQLMDVTTAQSQFGAGLEDAGQRLAQAEGRDQNFGQQLTSLRELIWELREEIAERFAKLAQVTEQHNRRQITDLEQNILDLKAQQNQSPRG